MGFSCFLTSPLRQVREDLEDARFIRWFEGEIRIFKVAENTEVLKLLALKLYVFTCVFLHSWRISGLAQLAYFCRRVL